MANKDKLLESAQKFLAKGQIPKAIGEYQKLIQAFPKDYRNRQKLAELLGREKRNDEAQPHYEAVAKNFAEMGFYLKAIAIYKQMQKIEPNRVDIYLRLAELNEKQGLIGNALNEYRSLLAFYDKNRMGRETVGILQKVIALDPENLGFRAKLIETHLAVGDETEALAQLRALVKFLAGKGEQSKVVKLYEKFINLCPEDVEHRLPLAEALVACGQHEKALALLKSLLKQAPDHPALLTALTDCHMAVGNHADARLTCQHLLKEQQNDLALRERYVRICIAGGDYVRALESLEESKDSFFQDKRIDVLKELYETLQAALPGDSRLQATLAAIYETTGDTGKRPNLATDGKTAVVEEETADAAVLDAAIDDVEHLDLVGDTTPPPAVVPPLGAPAKPAAPVEASGGLELELDLDLDLDLSSAAQPPAAPAPSTAPGVAPKAPASRPVPPAPEPPSSLELELDLGGLEGMEGIADEPAAVVEQPVPEEAAPAPALEMELDLGGLEGVELEPVAVMEQPLPEEAAPPEVELDLAGLGGVEAEPLPAEPVASVEQPVPDEGGAAPALELSLEEPGGVEALGGDLVFEVEPPSEAETAIEEPAADEPEVSEGFVAVEAAAIEEPEVLEELEEVEEVEVLEEAEALDELEELVEDVEDVEPEVFEEVESLEELEELDELEEITEEVEPVPVESVAISSQQLRNDLEEAEFYLRQGLFDDAERVARELQQRHGDLPELIEKLAEIDAQRQAAVEDESKGQAAEFDLMDDIRDGELLGATDFLDDVPTGEADGFSEAAPAEDNEDAQSHFDLGIAYKEMGLLDDAIGEFSKAAKDPSRRLDCLILKGQCQVEMGGFDKAEESFKEALDQLNVTEEVRVALQYELGLLYEATGRLPEALEKFQIVADLDLFFRDVTDKLKSLRSALGLDEDIEEAIAPRSNRDRISFV